MRNARARCLQLLPDTRLCRHRTVQTPFAAAKSSEPAGGDICKQMEIGNVSAPSITARTYLDGPSLTVPSCTELPP